MTTAKGSKLPRRPTLEFPKAVMRVGEICKDHSVCILIPVRCRKRTAVVLVLCLDIRQTPLKQT